MAIVSRDTLKGRFVTGSTPTQNDFVDLFDSFVSRGSGDEEINAILRNLGALDGAPETSLSAIFGGDSTTDRVSSDKLYEALISRVQWRPTDDRTTVIQLDDTPPILPTTNQMYLRLLLPYETRYVDPDIPSNYHPLDGAQDNVRLPFVGSVWRITNDYHGISNLTKSNSLKNRFCLGSQQFLLSQLYGRLENGNIMDRRWVASKVLDTILFNNDIEVRAYRQDSEIDSGPVPRKHIIVFHLKCLNGFRRTNDTPFLAGIVVRTRIEYVGKSTNSNKRAYDISNDYFPGVNNPNDGVLITNTPPTFRKFTAVDTFTSEVFDASDGGNAYNVVTDKNTGDSLNVQVPDRSPSYNKLSKHTFGIVRKTLNPRDLISVNNKSSSSL